MSDTSISAGRERATTSATVQTHALTKRYGASRGILDLTLRIEPSEIFGFIGPNGAGKTTTIRLLLDLIRPTSGTATIFGLDTRRDALEIRRRVGYLPGDLQLFDTLTAEQLFRWLDRLRGGRGSGEVAAHAAELAERLSLDCQRPIGDLSSGNRRKVGLIQAFMGRPELLILDEPTAGLDPVVQREFRSLLTEAQNHGTTVFLSSHVLTEVEDICDRVATIVDGGLRRIDSVSDLTFLARRHVRITFDDQVTAADLAALTGVHNLVVEPQGGGSSVRFDLSGSFDELVKFAAAYRVVDIISEPLSLEDVFLGSYDSADPSTAPSSTPPIGELSHGR